MCLYHDDHINPCSPSIFSVVIKIWFSWCVTDYSWREQIRKAHVPKGDRQKDESYYITYHYHHYHHRHHQHHHHHYHHHHHHHQRPRTDGLDRFLQRVRRMGHLHEAAPSMTNMVSASEEGLLRLIDRNTGTYCGVCFLRL